MKNNYNNDQRPQIKTTFYVTVFLSCILGLYLGCFMILEIIYELIFSIMLFVSLLITIYLTNKKNLLKHELFIFILFILLLFHLPSLLYSILNINIDREKKDYILLNIDSFLFGWLWPKGQLSISLDTNKLFGPHTSFGLISNNILQTVYSINLLFPYCFIYGYLLYLCIRDSFLMINRKKKKSKQYFYHWNNLLFLSSIYIMVYTLTIFINSIFPTISPSIYLNDEYENNIIFSSIAQLTNLYLKKIISRNCFPCIHTAETLSLSFGLFNIKYKKLSKIVFFLANLNIIGSLLLRYNYAFDCIVAYLIAIVVYNSICCTFEKEQLLVLNDSNMFTQDLSFPAFKDTINI